MGGPALLTDALEERLAGTRVMKGQREAIAQVCP